MSRLVDEVYDSLTVDQAQAQAGAALDALNENWNEDTPMEVYYQFVLASIRALGAFLSD